MRRILPLLLALALPAAAADLRVATGEVAPLVQRQGERLTGFSIELWSAIARRLEVRTEYLDLGPHSTEAQLAALRDGRADIALSAIIMTPRREVGIDFTTDYYDAGLQIAVSPDGDGGGSLLDMLPLAALRNLLLAGFGILLLLAHLLWLVERRDNPRFRQGYLRGIAEGLWGVMLIIATGEHGDRDTPRALKRITIAAMWLFGVVLIAQFTATVTSDLTVRQMQSSIRGPGDLPGKRIASNAESVAGEWLRDRGLPFTSIGSAEEAMRLLRSGALQAIVFDAPMLRYYARLHPDQLALVGPVFRPEKYSIAVPLGSPWRKRINAALLELFADGTYEDLHKRWFADE